MPFATRGTDKQGQKSPIRRVFSHFGGRFPYLLLLDGPEEEKEPNSPIFTLKRAKNTNDQEIECREEQIGVPKHFFDCERRLDFAPTSTGISPVQRDSQYHFDQCPGVQIGVMESP